MLSDNNYEIIEEQSFRKQKGDYQKKFSSLSSDVDLLKRVLLTRPEDGTALSGYRNPTSLYLRKSRMGCKSLQRGQSGGFRVFYAHDALNKKIYLLAMAIRNEEHKIDYKGLEQYLGLLNLK